eukprot:TRINITY_DN1685_c0_g6_i1.p1 TRINITY_DN1685_c0_g6~~TRINITY_DN1685_c0_g6_i1.p1  ORF type:complete len:753 (-),score=174.95 TRINITY_DN1685_c0_g6_i1:246-2504(-)
MPVAVAHARRTRLDLPKSMKISPKRAVRPAQEVKTTAQELMVACEDGNLDRLSALLAKGADVAVTDKNGCTPLTLAAWGGHSDVVDRLLDAGSKVDHTDYAGRTPLMRASQWGHTGSVQRLVARGAKVDASDSNGCTALTLAAQWGHHDTIEALIAAGATVDRQDKSDCTPLTWAAREGRHTVIERLLAAGASVDQKNNDGRTALMRAAYEGRTEVIERLLDAGAVADLADKNGCTALMHAAVAGHGEAIDRLLNASSVVDVSDSIGWTALMYAAYGGHSEAIGRLLAAGADIAARNLAELTAADIAEREGSYNVVALLTLPRDELEVCTALRVAVNENDSERVGELASDASLEVRRWVLRVFCESRRSGRHLCWLRLRRNHVFEDLVRAVLDPAVCRDMSRGFAIKFVGEPGVDEGGLTREMFEMVATEMADPSRGLFKMVCTEDPQSYTERSELAPDPTSMLPCARNPGAAAVLRQLYLACGRITALALSTGNLVEAYAKYFLQAVLGEDGGSLEDLMHEDPVLARTLHTLLERPLSELGVEPTFTCTLEGASEAHNTEVELMSGGNDVDVTEENKAEWVHKLVEYKLVTAITEQSDAFRQGMVDVLSEATLQLFCAAELKKELSGEGLDQLDDARLQKMIEAWQKFTDYEGGYSDSSRVVRWLWELVAARECLPGAVLRFVTGQSRVSESGFEALRPRFCIVCAGEDEASLPSAATCLNLLRLPDYSSKELLKQKLEYALADGGGHWTA